MRIKTLLILSVAALLLTACDKEPKAENKQQEFKEGYVYINVENEMKNGDEEKVPTAEEVVREAHWLKCTNDLGEENSLLGLGEQNKDYENNRLRFHSDMVVEKRPYYDKEADKLKERWELCPYFIPCRDVRVVDGQTNVIAYIPNAAMEKAEREIRAAWDKGDINECVRLFHEAWTCIPITGAQWDKLKEEGKQ